MPSIAIIGLGNRGRDAYLSNLRAYKDIQFTALCDPNRKALDQATQRIDGTPQLFQSDEEFFAAGKLADWLVIASPDPLHYPHAMAALKQGYHVLLEKPVTDVPQQLYDIADLAKEKNLHVLVCHVLRYTAYFRKIKELIADGTIGDVVSIAHEENVGYWHFAHSFTRGNWRNTDVGAPFLLAKCCHDLDLLQWFIDRPCESVHSYGGLYYFNEAHKPAGATPYCLDGCPHVCTCPYSIEKLYLVKKNAPGGSWTIPPASGLPYCPPVKELREILRKGSYGRCVYQCDNNVFDHQVVNMRFSDGVTATLTATAFSPDIYRRTHVLGTKGEIFGRDDASGLELNLFGEKKRFVKIKHSAYGHGGGDHGICETVHNLMLGLPVAAEHLTTIHETIASHDIGFAALESVATGQAVTPKHQAT
jgi:predicted dehydrogenase